MSLQTFFDSFALLADAPNGVEKLRELILQFAVEGKLVPQDSNNEPAYVLLEKIKATQARLVKEKLAKEIDVQPLASGNSLPFILPDGWQWTRLGSISQKLGAGSTPLGGKNVYQNNGVKFLRSQNVWNDGLQLDGVAYISEKIHQDMRSTQVESGDILLNITGASIGRSCIVPDDLGEANVSQHVSIVRLIDKQLRFFVHLCMISPYVQDSIMQTQVGISREGLSMRSLKEFVLPIPPLEEQKRIVAKVDELMRLCDELEARQQTRRESRGRLNNATLAPLNNAASLAPEEFEQAAARLADNFAVLYDAAETVGRLRSTILQLAVQGKLVPQDLYDESASVLLERIEEDREANKEKQKKKKIEFPLIKLDDAPFYIPSRWLWTRLGQLARLIEYGTSEKASLDNKGVPIFRMNNIEGGKVLHSNLKYASPTIKDLPRLYLKNNDLLFNRTNSFELVGKTGIFKGESDKFTFASYLIRIRLFDSYIFPDYINLSMNADYFRVTQINTEVTQQCGQANFNGTKLANTLIPLPPLGEQKRIVAKVNQLMALCDELETKLRQAEEDSAHLMKTAIQHVLASINKASQEEPLSVMA